MLDDIPDPDVLAYRLVARESQLDRGILNELIGRPKRYADLKPLLAGKGDHNLTVSLKRLQEWGLIDRRTDARQEPVVHIYELTPLGVQVVLAMPTIRPIQESVERFERARMHAALEDLEVMLQRGYSQRLFDREDWVANLPPAAKGLLSSMLVKIPVRPHEGLYGSHGSVREASRLEPRLEEFFRKRETRRTTSRR